MITPTDYLAVLQSYVDPNNGTVSYWYAQTCAKLIKLSEQFESEYNCMEGERIDLGEFYVWVFQTI